MSFSDWRTCKLGDVLNFRRGHDLPKTKMVNGIYPVVGSNGVIGYHNEYKSENPCVTVGRSGNVGKPHILYERSWAHNTTLYIDDYKGNNPEFIYYFLHTLNLENFRGGSAVPTLNRNHIHPIEISIPKSVSEQKAIAHILSTLDEKIEVNNKINKILEKMAQEIFKHWFVDFEFPNEDGEPYKSSGGEMIESELGLIPKGWIFSTITDICEVRDGTHDSPKASKEGFRLITSKHLQDNYIDFDSAKYISEADYNKVNERSKVDRYDILITMIGTVGNIYLVQDENIEFAIKNIGLFKTSTNLNYFEYIYLLLKSDEMRQHINQRLAGSTQKYISLTELRKIPIVIPTEDILSEFKKISNSMLTKIYINEKENDRLRSISDTLLPKLMSGQIRVPLNND
ncbi:MAG TPA: restriction endonuclease subunit S [Tissierellaceae bacterium]|nr:restriction endonuclease subunit S [Tissierellaceae bacterium]